MAPVVHGLDGDAPVVTVLAVFPPEQGKEFTLHTLTVTVLALVAPVPLRVMLGFVVVPLENWSLVIVRPVTAKLCWTWGAAL